jgi:hypothetical protein
MAQQKFLFIYHSPVQTEERAPSPEEMQQMFAQWDAWKAKFQKNILDLGDGLKPGGKILANGVVTDGPFPETKDVVAGYSIVQAQSYDEALAVARECPMTFVPGAKIEVRELAGFE